MKKTIIHLALVALFTGGVAFAQDNTSQDQATTPPPMHGPRHQKLNPDNQLAHLTKALNLTSDQQTQIKPLLDSQQSQIMQVHQDTSISRDDKVAKAKSIHEDTNSKIEAVLNDDQKQRYEKMQARMQRRHGGAAAPAQATSPQQ